jgi:hypothetical protein
MKRLPISTFLLFLETHFANLRNQQGTPGARFVLPILSYGF